MKKILATLLVAAMLMSCLTFISFAVTAEVYTVTNMLGDEFYAYDESEEAFSEFLYSYAPFVQDEKNLGTKAKKNNYADPENTEAYGNDPLYDYAWNEDPEAEKVTAIDVKKNSYVALPIFANGDGACSYTINVDYDGTKFEFVNFNLIAEDWAPSVGTITGAGTASAKLNNYGAYVAGTNSTGLLAVYFFKPLATGIGDASGEATGKFTITPVEIKYNDGTANMPDVPMTTKVMSVALSGLQPGEDIGGGEEEAEKVTGTDFAAATVAAKGLAVSGFAADTTGVNVVAGAANSNNYKDTDVYSCIFAEVPVIDGYEAIEKAGICLVSSTGYKSYYPSLTIGATTNKFGMVFFGAETLLEKYTAYVYVEYADGTKVLSDDSYTLIGE